MQLGFFFDQSRCTGCFTCVIACKEWHDVTSGPVDYRNLVRVEQGKYPHPSLAYLTLSCLHCERPLCADACPTNAIVKRPSDGVVLVDSDLCLGRDKCPCFCKAACPYSMPAFGKEENAKMQMCDMCVDRLAAQEQPICMAACSTRALQVGNLSALMVQHGLERLATGFLYSEQANPSIVFKPKRK